MSKGTGDADDSTDFAVLIEQGFLGGGGPIDEAIASGNEFDSIDDGVASLKDFEVVFANVFEDGDGDVVVVFFSNDFVRL